MLVVILLSSFSYIVEANGSVRTYEKKITEIHEIGLGTVPETPTRGVIHFAAYVKNVYTGVNYSDAEVYIKAYEIGSDKPKVGPLKMINGIMDPTYYEADFPLETKGIWQIVININTEDGNSSGVFKIEVYDPNPVVPILTLVFLIILLIILGISVRTWIREYRKNKTRQ